MGVPQQQTLEPPTDGTATSTRDAWAVAVLVTACVAVLAGIFAVGLATRAPAEGGTAGARTVAVELGDNWVRPRTLDVAPGTELTLEVVNDGELVHDLKLHGETGTRMLAPGESETVALGEIGDDAEAWCTVPGHLEAGMVQDIRVDVAAAVTAG